MQAHERDDVLMQIREDVAVIKARMEVIPDHEERLRKVERRLWGVPGTILAAVLAAAGVHFGN